MTVTLTSRKRTRQQLRDLLDEITTLVEVFDHQAVDFGRRTPVAMVYSDGTRTQFPDYAREYHRFIIEFWWGRDDANLTEDYLDDLAQEVRQKLYDNMEASGYWEDIAFDEEFSELDYPIVDGIQYRRERLRVTVFVICE